MVGIRRDDEIGGIGEEVLESEGKRVFEIWKCCLEEVLGWMVKLEEENALDGEAGKPWDVKESEWKGGWRRK